MDDELLLLRIDRLERRARRAAWLAAFAAACALGLGVALACGVMRTAAPPPRSLSFESNDREYSTVIDETGVHVRRGRERAELNAQEVELTSKSGDRASQSAAGLMFDGHDHASAFYAAGSWRLDDGASNRVIASAGPKIAQVLIESGTRTHVIDLSTSLDDARLDLVGDGGQLQAVTNARLGALTVEHGVGDAMVMVMVGDQADVSMQDRGGKLRSLAPPR